MEIFAMNSRHIIDSILKLQNKEIDKTKFNSEIFLDITFNYFYFKKERKKTIKLKEAQNKVFQSFFKKETTQEIQEKLLKKKVRQNQETAEHVEEIIMKQREELLSNLLKHKDISIYAEHSYNSYIPPKNMSISLNFHLSDLKEFKKYLSNSDANITYKNPSLSNPKKDLIITSYYENPYLIDKDNDIFILNKNKTNDISGINDNEQKETQNKIEDLINYEEDDILFYPEKLEKQTDIDKSSKWLNNMSTEEINSNFSNLNEVRKNNKNFNNSNNFTFDQNYSISEFDTESIFDDIPLGGDRYKKFSNYLSDKSYKNYMKKMNYNYLDSMLLNYFDLLNEFEKYNFLERSEIALNFIKKIILASGICHSKIYDHIIKSIISKKGNFNLENFIECFSPIFEVSDKLQPLKYRFLLYLAKSPSSPILSMENYKFFCNLIKGKMVYEEDICKKLSKNMIESFKKKYPNEYTDNFIYFHIATIVDCLVDRDYNDI